VTETGAASAKDARNDGTAPKAAPGTPVKETVAAAGTVTAGAGAEMVTTRIVHTAEVEGPKVACTCYQVLQHKNFAQCTSN
jgi:hypothetical protein